MHHYFVLFDCHTTVTTLSQVHFTQMIPGEIDIPKKSESVVRLMLFSVYDAICECPRNPHLLQQSVSFMFQKCLLELLDTVQFALNMYLNHLPYLN